MENPSEVDMAKMGKSFGILIFVFFCFSLEKYNWMEKFYAKFSFKIIRSSLNRKLLRCAIFMQFL